VKTPYEVSHTNLPLDCTWIENPKGKSSRSTSESSGKTTSVFNHREAQKRSVRHLSMPSTLLTLHGRRSGVKLRSSVATPTQGAGPGIAETLVRNECVDLCYRSVAAVKRIENWEISRWDFRLA